MALFLYFHKAFWLWLKKTQSKLTMSYKWAQVFMTIQFQIEKLKKNYQVDVIKHIIFYLLIAEKKSQSTYTFLELN